MALTIQKDQMHHALKIRILCLTFVLMYELVFAPINPIYNFELTTFCHNWNRPIDNPLYILILILIYEHSFESPIPVFRLVKTMYSR